MNRKTILYIAASADGYIAKPGDNLDFLNAVAQEGEDYGYGAFYDQIDTVIMGKRTYDWVMEQVSEFPHQGKETYVLTREKLDPIGTIQFYSGNLSELVSRLKTRTGKHIFVDGGAQTVHRFLEDGLLDEVIISYIPVLLGEGIRLFQGRVAEQKLELVSSKNYTSGLVQVHYRVVW
ncbi:MAG: dihydrofolate reductase family protein [Algoriphagus sp.]|uniref:dihydrofolate reductase family protein n=1 Tax=Algoriphagus sp. TaxID=1872435 RepID=UPI0027312A4E|nr:dihydrofolate reductase family protein [Algoriphagus sp.]MDP2042924.1 dihydrofolate reductase family protein [Algoriphagus sp.]MDP3473421.1 dihydrofolate reductase family protein [Algoriphagus sp.]